MVLDFFVIILNLEDFFVDIISGLPIHNLNKLEIIKFNLSKQKSWKSLKLIIFLKLKAWLISNIFFSIVSFDT